MQGRSYIQTHIVVSKIRHRLKRYRPVPSLIIASGTHKPHCAIVNLLYLITARHVSRKLFTYLRRSSKDSHACMIILLKLLHGERIHLVLSVILCALGKNLIRKICIISVSFAWRAWYRSCNWRQPARNFCAHISLFLDYRVDGEPL